ncbi:MAG TPA: hypothetical protein VMH23_17180 [Bacteroidota bacterium]|nr:hypothetical protein [Bacteroidota bacterium]
MKRFAWFTGLVVLMAAVAVPVYLKNKVRDAACTGDDNIRYDIDDYMAAEGL